MQVWGVLDFRHTGPTGTGGGVSRVRLSPPLIRPTQRLAGANGDEIVERSVTEGERPLLCLHRIKIILGKPG